MKQILKKRSDVFMTNSTNNTKQTSRIHFLDELRGLLIILMVIHHAFYTIGYIYDVHTAQLCFDFIETYLHPIGASLFIVICGFSCNLSHNNLKRGLELAAVSVAMSAFLYFIMPDEMIWFGILHCLSICILIYAATDKLLSKSNKYIFIAINILFFILTYNLANNPGTFIGISPNISLSVPDSISNISVLSIFGLSYVASADYFPLFPWMFMFFIGAISGKLIISKKIPGIFYREHSRFLSWIGKHTLAVYIIHQPVIYGLCWLIFKLIK